MKTKSKNVIKTVVNVVLWIFLAFALVATVFSFISQAGGKEYPVIGENCMLCVQSESMNAPDDYYQSTNYEVNKGFKTGDLIICKTLNADEKRALKVGDVITFYVDLDGDGEKELNTHRIIEVLSEDGEKYRTQGDNNAIADGYTVEAAFIEAKWTGEKVAGLGGFISFFSSTTGFLICIVIPLGLFFIYEMIFLILTIKNFHRERHPVLTNDDVEAIKARAVAEFLAKQQAEQESKNGQGNSENNN